MRIGYDVAIQPLSGPNAGFLWTVRYFGREIMKGMAKTEAKAKTHAALAAGKLLVEQSAKSTSKQKHYLKLRAYLTKRPYGVAAAVEQLLAGNRLKTAKLQAEDNEFAWWERDKEPAHPWPVHELSKTSEELLELVYTCAAGVGWVTFDEDGGIAVQGPKLHKWAVRVFGARWFDTGPGGGED